MVYYVAGTNIFGQWPCDSQIINKFHTIKEIKLNDTTMMPFKIIHINWAYNILQFDKNFYISGCSDGQGDQLVKLPLPFEISLSNDEVTVVGNDQNLCIINKNTNSIWLCDLNLEQEIKKIRFIEEPLNDAKKIKNDIKISKVALVNDSCLYLTSLCTLYSGILPNYIDTGHCIGEVCDIQCGYEHFMLLTSNGYVYTWGNGRRLQLGHGDINVLEIPTKVEALAGIKVTKISSGGWHSLALSEFGDLYAWGWNESGQLGIKRNDFNESYPEPTLVQLFDSNGIEVTMNVIDIACGSRHSAILLEDKTVWTTGYNKYGQLGFSEVEFPTINYFKKVFKCDYECKLMCGPWTTVIICD